MNLSTSRSLAVLFGLGWLVLTSLSGKALAEEKGLYRIEVLVFRFLDPTQLEGEQWQENPGYPRFDKAIKLLPASSEASISFASPISEFEDMDPDNTVSSSEPDERAEPQTFALTQDKNLAARQLENEGQSDYAGTDVNPGKTEDTATSPVYWVPFQALEKEQLSIAPMWDRLSESEKYAPMLLQGWVQSIEPPDRSRAVYIGEVVADEAEQPAQENDAGLLSIQASEMGADPDEIQKENIEGNIPINPEEPSSHDISSDIEAGIDPNQAEAPGDAWTVTDSLTGDIGEMPGQTPSEPFLDEQPRVEGILRASKSNYFHLDIDLALTLPVEDSAEESSFYINDSWRRVFRLFESRRIKIGQINYFDHPAFGVLVKVVDLVEDHQDEVAR